ncbi:hypothetical protein BV20DRAFT_751807 [Pilatotrama ljubarskyi]|nr:hypothetical protein BV20DRAFT_751807 [Pilatotrama ljubarskyi]
MHRSRPSIVLAISSSSSAARSQLDMDRSDSSFTFTATELVPSVDSDAVAPPAAALRNMRLRQGSSFSARSRSSPLSRRASPTRHSPPSGPAFQRHHVFRSPISRENSRWSDPCGPGSGASPAGLAIGPSHSTPRCRPRPFLRSRPCPPARPPPTSLHLALGRPCRPTSPALLFQHRLQLIG